MRRRRQHDLRRTFISLARADGAIKDVLKSVTHGRGDEVIDQYTEYPWPVKCEAVKALILDLTAKRTEVIKVAAVSIELSQLLSQLPLNLSNSANLLDKNLAGWTGLEPAASGVTGRRYNQLNYHPSSR
jgi:hypothetical protein